MNATLAGEQSPDAVIVRRLLGGPFSLRWRENGRTIEFRDRCVAGWSTLTGDEVDRVRNWISQLPLADYWEKVQPVIPEWVVLWAASVFATDEHWHYQTTDRDDRYNGRGNSPALPWKYRND
jgi:hypothetical protein